MDTLLKNKYKTAVSYLLRLVSSKRLGIHFDEEPKPDKVEDIELMVKEKIGLDLYNLKKDEYVKYELALSDVLSDILSNPLQDNIEDEITLIDKSVNIRTPIPASKIILDKSLRNRFKRLGLTLSGIDSYFLEPDFVSMIKLRDVEYLIETKKIKNNNGYSILLSLVQIERMFGKIEAYKVADSYLLHFDKFESLYSSPIRLFLNLLNEYGAYMEFNGVKKKFFINIEEKNIPDSAIFKILTPKKGITLKLHGNPIMNGTKQVGLWIPFAYLFDWDLYIQDYKKHKI